MVVLVLVAELVHILTSIRMVVLGVVVKYDLLGNLDTIT